MTQGDDLGTMMGVAGRRIVFGLVVPQLGSVLPARVDALTKVLGEHAGLEVERRDAANYEALATEVREGSIDIAWLPPIVYVRLAGEITPLGSILRDGQSTYEAALVVKSSSPFMTIDGLRQSRAGWVDPWSAAGFVMPRVKLALLGVDPRTVFRSETFYGSHRAAMQALADGACDVAGTFCRADESGTVIGGGWSEIEGAEVRVLATFGAIPPDVIAVKKDFPEDDRKKVLEALRSALANDETRTMVREIFGGEELREDVGTGYEALNSALEMASARGLFD